MEYIIINALVHRIGVIAIFMILIYSFYQTKIIKTLCMHYLFRLF
jgi:hypothetical protein